MWPASRRLEIGIAATRAPQAGHLVAHLDDEPAHRRHKPHLEARHVVEERARQEERIIGDPGVVVDLAVDQPGRNLDGLAAASQNIGRHIGVDLDRVHQKGTNEKIENEEQCQDYRHKEQPTHTCRPTTLTALGMLVEHDLARHGHDASCGSSSPRH
jgi:hypothetical protein